MLKTHGDCNLCITDATKNNHCAACGYTCESKKQLVIHLVTCEIPLPQFKSPKHICIGCKEEFIPTRSDQVKCKKNCNRPSSQSNKARKLFRLDRELEFIGVDGEGVGYDNADTGERHKYLLLSVGTQYKLQSKEHLHWEEIFSFLYHTCFKENPKACFVGFFLGYDFAQWFKTVPQDRAIMLLSPAGRAARARTNSGGNTLPFPVRLGYGGDPYAWEFDVLGLRRLRLRPGKPPGIENENKWMYICDTASYFQMAFLNVLKDKKGVLFPGVEEWEYEIIRKGKENRSAATEVTEDMIIYNALENDLLARVMRKLDEGFKSEGIILRKDNYYGPGQATQAWMRNIGMPTREETEAAVPLFARLAAQATYYGGWFEIFRHGTIPGTIYEYDINSAYPAEMCFLPCLLHGEWITGTGKDRIPHTCNSITMLYGTSTGSDKYAGGLPHRNKKGQILRPLSTKGWYWHKEIQASERAGLIDSFDIEEWIHYNPCDCESPLAPMKELYLKRTTIPEGKDSPRGIALKLVYNSAYGKLAQSIGQPRYANAIYASLITSGTRIRILNAIATHPNGTEDLLMVATDGVYFRTEHPTIEIDPSALGKWSNETKDRITLFLPGLYWDNESRKRVASGGKPKIKSRGVPGIGLATVIHKLDEQFENFNGIDWPTESIHIPFTIISPTQALARGTWALCGWTGEADKKITSNPKTKRYPVGYPDPKGGWYTKPYVMGEQLETKPYDKTFGASIVGDTDEMTQDGPAVTLIISALHKEAVWETPE